MPVSPVRGGQAPSGQWRNWRFSGRFDLTPRRPLAVRNTGLADCKHRTENDNTGCVTTLCITHITLHITHYITHIEENTDSQSGCCCCPGQQDDDTTDVTQSLHNYGTIDVTLGLHDDDTSDVI